MAPVQIFISYRRDDSAGYARAIGDALAREFGAERVFIDVDDIDAGQAFANVIERAVGDAKVLLVLIGKRWLGERAGLPARIEEAGDLVRLEVASALARGMQVIPLLLDGTAMPTVAQLPEELHPLLGRNALEIDNTRFAGDIERLIAALRDTLETPRAPAPSAPHRPKRALLWSAIGALLVAGSAVALWSRRVPTPVIATRPDINGEWQAEVNYDWPNARYDEHFRFAGEAGELQGSASFLGVPRGFMDGRIEAGELRFVTRTSEVGGDSAANELVHSYRGRWAEGEVRFVMQTDGGSTTHVPVEFVARRAR